MEAVLGLFLILLRLSCGIEFLCDGRQNGTQCYGALGGTLVLQLMDKAPARLDFRNTSSILMRFRENSPIQSVIVDRCSYTPENASLRISNLRRTESGNHTVEVFNSNGVYIMSWTLHLFIQARLSPVSLNAKCVTQGEVRASCSSEVGDSPQYSWTLGRQALTEDKLISKENNVITLRTNTSERLVCIARNNVSEVSDSIMISTCGFINCTLPNGTHISQWVFTENNTLCVEPTTVPPVVTHTSAGKETLQPSIITSTNQTETFSSEHPWFFNNLTAIVGALCALVLLLVVGVAIIAFTKKKRKSKAKAAYKADEDELIYADVRIVQRLQVQPEADGEYSEVRLSGLPPQTVEQPDCVYSQVARKPKTCGEVSKV